MSTDDPNQSYILRRLEALEQLLRANPLRNAYVGRGITEWGENSTLRITDSNMEVVGAAFISGLLEVVGRLSVRGLGILEVAGLIDLVGRMRVHGGGDVTVEDGGDVVVDGGQIRAGDVIIRDGKILIGGMVLDPSIGGGALIFPNGSRIEADAANSGERLIAGDAVLNVGDVASLRKGSTSVIISSLGVTVNAPSGEEILLQGAVRIPLASVPTYAGTGLPAGTLRLSTSGRLERADGT